MAGGKEKVVGLRRKEARPGANSDFKAIWDGSEVDRLFIWSEQGVGDEVMFASALMNWFIGANSLLWHAKIA